MNGVAAAMAAGAIAGKFDDGAPNTNGMIAGAPAAGGVKVEGAAAKVKAGTVAAAEETLLAAAGTAAPNTNGAWRGRREMQGGRDQGNAARQAECTGRG
jgi:hypothetical protein